MPVATAHRICNELDRLGYLQRVPGTRLWTVAYRLVGLGADALTAAAVGLPATAILRELTEKLGEVSSFAVQSGDEVLYVASVESPHALTLSFRAGRRAPLFCTSSGRLFLSRLDDQTISRYLNAARRRAFTRYTVTDPRELLAIIRRVRKQGYAMTSQQYVLHVVGAAVPVTAKDGTFFGALSVAAPDVRTGPGRMQGFLSALKSAATRLAEALAQQSLQAPRGTTAARQAGSGRALRRAARTR